MIDSAQYIETVRRYFSFLITEFNLHEISHTINGNAFFDIQYGDTKKTISISYENIEAHLKVIVFKLLNGNLPDYNDEAHTLYLSALNALAMPKTAAEDFIENNLFFAAHAPKNTMERQLLKSGKDLRLCLKLMPEL